MDLDAASDNDLRLDYDRLGNVDWFTSPSHRPTSVVNAKPSWLLHHRPSARIDAKQFNAFNG